MTIGVRGCVRLLPVSLERMWCRSGSLRFRLILHIFLRLAIPAEFSLSHYPFAFGYERPDSNHQVPKWGHKIITGNWRPPRTSCSLR